ncbi:protein JTB isoform X3 [Rhineura floridana]|uniref:protein JTB isoform X3 n=1 Tax=Rhineura floridana TaxID=261503 RepID=UPI002AC7F228|nr:protein JTB isoform X3 [Rhineura floridana]
MSMLLLYREGYMTILLLLSLLLFTLVSHFIHKKKPQSDLTRLAEVAFESDGKNPASLPGVTLCWQSEEFVVTQQCAPCQSFQAKTVPECSATGFVEQINCSDSKKGEFKSRWPCFLG